MSDKTDTIVIDADLYWPFLTRENPMSPGKHTVEVCNLTAEDKKKLASLGTKITPRTKEGQPEKGEYITLKQSSKMGPMQFKYPNRTVLTEDELSRLGNGTRARLKIGTFTNDFGTFLSYIGGVVLEPKWYEGSGKDDDMFEDLDVDSTSTELDDEIPF